MNNFTFQGQRIKCEKEILGRGAFSIVFRGICDGNPAAIKRILFEDKDVREEEFMTASLQHENVVRFLCKEENSDFK